MSPARAVVAALAVALACASSLAACGEERAREDAGAPRDPSKSTPPEPPRGGDVRLFKRSRPMMGTIFEITVAGSTDELAEPAVRAALDEIQRLETVLSEWRPDSEISRINAAAGSQPVQVGEETMAVVKAGVEVSRWSDGAFDLSWAALRGMYTFQPGEENIPPLRDVRAKLPLVDWQRIAVDDAAQTIFLSRDGMAIGTGGIAKGYALDRAAAILQRAGLASFMLFGGGQVQVRGMRGDRAWRVGIQHPRQPTYFAFLEATGGSVSTSGDYEHAFVDREGRRWHHIIDTDTGLPSTKSMSVTLLSERGIYADALSTAAFVLGPERALAMLAALPFRAEAVIVGADCKLYTTPGTAERLVMRTELADGALPGCEPIAQTTRGSRRR